MPACGVRRITVAMSAAEIALGAWTPTGSQPIEVVISRIESQDVNWAGMAPAESALIYRSICLRRSPVRSPAPRFAKVPSLNPARGGE
jgi:hypothetical protein